MTDILERRYARLLAVYPAEYRRARGAEVLETLLASAEPGRARPSMREATALVLNALRARANALGRRTASQTWLPTLRSAALMLLVYDAARNLGQFALNVADGDFSYGVLSLITPEALNLVSAVLVLLAVLCVARDRYLSAIALAAGAFLAVPVLERTLGDGLGSWRVPLAVVFLLPLLRRRNVAMPGLLRYLSAVPIIFVASSVYTLVGGPGYVRLQTVVYVTISLAALAWLVVDERVTLAIGLLLLGPVLEMISYAFVFDYRPFNWALAFVLTVVAPAFLLISGATATRRRARL